MKRRAAVGAFVGLLLMAASAGFGQQWREHVRGSWVRQGEPQDGDIVLFDGKTVCDIVVDPVENSAVKQAATFLAGDLEKLTGRKPQIVVKAVEGHSSIRLSTAPDGQQDASKWPWSFAPGAWEAYDVRTTDRSVFCVGSDFRGTAYAAYELAERMGIDPLYHWTCYRPERVSKLVLKKTDHHVGSPTFKYRGCFHDDEDILPRPLDDNGIPLQTGDVPTEWYAKYFETALRLRMNMVAPYTRVHRRYEVQKMASDWGLIYTSHHYDILLSNPYGIVRYGLGQQRNAGIDWDWFKNKQGILNYWQGGVDENKALECYWPVGLRGTDDTSYKFPAGMTDADRVALFREAINTQVKMVKDALPAGHAPLFHFTMYNEMLNQYLKDPKAFGLPEDVTIVWTDNNDGRMRFLPDDLGKWKHGVYYHLAYLGPVTKQNAHVVTPAMVSQEFKKIVDAGATEYVLVNVSEMREFVMELRMLADVCWDAKTALADEPPQPRPAELLTFTPSAKQAAEAASQPASNPAADRYVQWWCREYFGDDAGPIAAQAYDRYYTLLNSYDKLWYGSDKVQGAIDSLQKKFAGEKFAAARPETLPTLTDRMVRYGEALALCEAAKSKMGPVQRQFFYDHVELPLRMDYQPTVAAMTLVKAMGVEDPDVSWQICEGAMLPLQELEADILRAEHPPFENWYRKTWVRHGNSPFNVHRPYEQLRVFLASGGKDKLVEPPRARSLPAATRTTNRAN